VSAVIANALVYAGPLAELLELLSREEFVPEPARAVMAPVSRGLEAAETLGPPLTELVTASWDSVAALGAGRTVADIGRNVGALAESSVEISRITGVAAEIVVRGTVEVAQIVQEFAARAAALGPALVTPGGQVALLGLAAEHLVRGIHVVERVQSELQGPTDELRRVAAAIPDAPAAPVGLSGADTSTGGGAAATQASWSPGRGGAGAGPAAESYALAEGAGAFGGGGDAPAGGDGGAGGAGAVPTGPASSGVVGSGVQVVLPDGSSATAPNEKAAGAVRAALAQQGVPYVWGGTSPGVGLDCSGLTQYAYGEAGVELPRLAQEQGVGTPVAQSDLMPGDLAVWDGHVAMYVGNDQLVEAGDPVEVSPLRTENIGMAFHGFYRPTAS